MVNKALYTMNEVSVSQDTPQSFDYLITSLDNGEERSWSLINELVKKETIINRLIVFAFGISKDETQKRIDKLEKPFVDTLLFSQGEKTEYQKNVGIIRELMDSLNEKAVVGIDITSMPTPQYFLLIKWLSRNISELYVYYTKPQRYIMNKGLFKSYFSTVGPVSVTEISGFTGITANDENGDRVLVCMLGFDNDLLPRVIQDAGPQKIVAINGFPSFFPKFKDISLANNQRILSGNDYAPRLEKTKNLSDYVYVEADNPFESYNALGDIANEHGQYCIDVVPLGTKPMALGICLYAIEHSNIRVVFPIPEVYAPATSQESSKTVEYVLSFMKGKKIDESD